MGPSPPGGSAAAKGRPLCPAARRERDPHPHHPRNTSLRNVPAPEAMPTWRYGFNPRQAAGSGSHRLQRGPRGRCPFPRALLAGRLSPTLPPPPAGNGDPDPRAAPAPFPQRGSRAETLNPDEPV